MTPPRFTTPMTDFTPSLAEMEFVYKYLRKRDGKRGPGPTVRNVVDRQIKSDQQYTAHAVSTPEWQLTYQAAYFFPTKSMRYGSIGFKGDYQRFQTDLALVKLTSSRRR